MKRVPKLEEPRELDQETTLERRAQLKHMVEKTLAEQRDKSEYASMNSIK